MKKAILFVVMTGFLTGCPNREEIKNMQEDILNKKTTAMKFLSAQDYSLESLLKIQEYFFNFSEKVHLIKVEEEARKNIQKMMKKKGGVSEFCRNFVMPLKYWQPLEQYCSSGTFYKCSPEIREYRNTLQKLKQLAGPELIGSLNSDPACN